MMVMLMIMMMLMTLMMMLMMSSVAILAQVLLDLALFAGAGGASGLKWFTLRSAFVQARNARERAVARRMGNSY